MEEILHQLIASLSHYLQDSIHPRWLAGFPINSSCTYFWVNHIISGSFFCLNCQALKGEIIHQKHLKQLREWLRVTWLLPLVKWSDHCRHWFLPYVFPKTPVTFIILVKIHRVLWPLQIIINFNIYTLRFFLA